MKKSIFITLILTLVLAMSAFASRTRVLTMGDNNTILLDDNNIWQFPSRINDYPGLAVGEIATGDVTQFGIHWKLGDDNPYVLATYFDNQSPLQPDDLLGLALLNFTDLPPPSPPDCLITEESTFFMAVGSVAIIFVSD